MTLAQVDRYIIEDELTRKNLQARSRATSITHRMSSPSVANGTRADPADALDLVGATRRDAHVTSPRGQARGALGDP